MLNNNIFPEKSLHSQHARASRVLSDTPSDTESISAEN